MRPVSAMAAILADEDVDLGDERQVAEILAREFPIQVVYAHLEEAIESARELRTCFVVPLS